MIRGALLFLFGVLVGLYLYEPPAVVESVTFAGPGWVKVSAS